MYVADPVAKQKRDCAVMTGSVSNLLARIEIYYRDDKRKYSEFNPQNASALEDQMQIYRQDRILHQDRIWHPVDLYYFAQDDIRFVDVLCETAETERYKSLIAQTAERHPELSSTTSAFIADWNY